jgi:hypothetical protein
MLKSCRILSVVVATFVVWPTAARAQQNAMSASPQGDIGVKLSEKSVLHVGVAAEAGYDTNIFYNDNLANDPTTAGTPNSSAVMRVIPSFLITNNGRDGKPQSTLVYSLGANLVYREYLNQNENVRAQRSFVPSAVGTLAFKGEKSSFSLSDMFSRSEDAPYRPTDKPIIRDTNQATAIVGISPGGGRITTSLRYNNQFDYFETQTYRSASSMTHDGLLDVSWKWLPKTAIFLQGGGGFVHYLEPAAPGSAITAREDSAQVRAMTGLRGLVSPKTTVNLGVGYATAFYETQSNPSGLSNLLVQLDVGYMPTLMSRLNLQLLHGFRNSPVIGNYYDFEAAELRFSHQLGQLVAGLSSAFEYRRYRNYRDAMGATLNRRDVLLNGGVNVDYYIQSWFYAGASYNVGLSRPDGDPAAVTYTKQQILARLGVAY